jgi:hypothetical protein
MSIVLIFLVLCLLQILLVIHFKKPHFITHRLKIKAKKQTFRTVIICLIVFFYILLILALKHWQRFQPIPLIPVHTAPAQFGGDATGHAMYTKLGYRESPDIQNFYFLYSSQDKSKDTLAKLANQIRKSDCIKLCIINFYDDMHAYTVDMERINITIPQVMDDWNQRNYIFVAEHYLGYSGPDANASFAYYPFKDWFYHQSTSQEQEEHKR